MRVFVTGATGFVGSAIVRELLSAGHHVIGLTRSEAGAKALASAGVEVHHGNLDDLDSLRSGAAASEGVIHTAYNHAFTDFAGAAETDRQAIEALGSALVGTGHPFVITSGTAGSLPGRLRTEEDAGDPTSPGAFRVRSEHLALELASQNVRVSVMRLPPSVHGEGDYGFVPRLISIAREKGVSAYVGDGSNRWPSVHRLDAVRLYRLALETAPAGTRLHAVADEGVPTLDIATVIGRRLNVPVVGIPVAEATQHFGWLGHFFSMDVPASSKLTQQKFGWQPIEANLLADLDHDYYFQFQ